LKPDKETRDTVTKNITSQPNRTFSDKWLEAERRIKTADPLQNPYDKLLQFTEQTNVLHVQKSTVLVKVPRISKNDLNTLLLWAV
jgi:hypothetical protein